MFRTRLRSFIQQEAEKSGYHFRNGFLYRITRNDLTFPALWMEPPSLTDAIGRHEGKITYHVTLHLITSGKNYDEAEKEAQWENLEKQALTWTQNLLAHDDIFSVDKIRCSPAEFSLTNRGEISLKIEFDTHFIFPLKTSEP